MQLNNLIKINKKKSELEEELVLVKAKQVQEVIKGKNLVLALL